MQLWLILPIPNINIGIGIGLVCKKMQRQHKKFTNCHFQGNNKKRFLASRQKITFKPNENMRGMSEGVRLRKREDRSD